jgi:hypothetical protein
MGRSQPLILGYMSSTTPRYLTDLLTCHSGHQECLECLHGVLSPGGAGWHAMMYMLEPSDEPQLVTSPTAMPHPQTIHEPTSNGALYPAASLRQPPTRPATSHLLYLHPTWPTTLCLLNSHPTRPPSHACSICIQRGCYHLSHLSGKRLRRITV